jgi:hypothetical protein
MSSVGTVAVLLILGLHVTRPETRLTLPGKSRRVPGKSNLARIATAILRRMEVVGT